MNWKSWPPTPVSQKGKDGLPVRAQIQLTLADQRDDFRNYGEVDTELLLPAVAEVPASTGRPSRCQGVAVRAIRSFG